MKNPRDRRMVSRRNLPGLIAISAGAVLLLRGLLRQGRRMSFRGASVVVTGGSRGLGLDIARLFAREGARLTLLARDREELERARRELISLGGYVMIRVCDIGNEREVREAVDFVMRERGRIDVLVNNAGTIRVGPFEHTDVHDLDEALNEYVRGPFFLIKAAVPHMRNQGRGRIVNVSSIAGLVAIPHLVPYSAAKQAETGLSDGIRAELAKDNILVTTVLPGLMRTGSYVNALFKGQQSKEFGWFGLSAVLPLTAASAERAAARIVEACRHGDPVLFIAAQTRLLQMTNTMFPGLTAFLMKQAARMLPSAGGAAGSRPKTGWKSATALSSKLIGAGKNNLTRHHENRAA